MAGYQLCINCYVFSIKYSKQSSISDTEYDPLGNSDLPFHVGAGTAFDLLLLYDFLNIFYE